MNTSLIWNLNVPVGSGFAELMAHYKEPKGTKCPQCGKYVDIEPEPLSVEWDDGSDVIGDFVHAGANIIVRDEVAAQLGGIATGFATTPIHFFDHPNLRLRERKSKRKLATRVWLPYEGPPLSQLVVTRYVPLADESTVEIESKCEHCGTVRYKRLLGVEVKTGAMSKQREPAQGIFVHTSDLGGDEVFSPRGTSIVLCTTRVKEFVEIKGFSNVEFLEYGNVI